MMNGVGVIILAAGNGTRMNSAYPKVMCKVLGKPMLAWVLDSCKKAGIADENLCIVLPQDSSSMAHILPKTATTVVQNERLGTGHGAACGMDFVKSKKPESVVVVFGDTPFVDETVLTRSYNQHKKHGNAITLLTGTMSDPTGYGRIIRGAVGVSRIVEEKDALPEEKAVTEVNSGVMWFSADCFAEIIPQIGKDNEKNEYYLTEAVSLCVKEHRPVGACRQEDVYVIQGANDRKTLSKLNREARDRVLERLFESGVDIPSTESVLISPDTTVGRDTVILPSVVIEGTVTIGENCHIGQGVTIRDSVIGDNCTITAGSFIEYSVIGSGTLINSSNIEHSKVGDNVRIGPYSHLRPNSTLMNNVKIGNFVEVKNSVLGEKTSVAHLTYVGDSDVGSGVNFGCGVVTVNYDGKGKYRTTVGDGVFIGCNTNLIAPVTVGDNAYIAAATTITDDVPEKAFVIGRSRQENKPPRG